MAQDLRSYLDLIKKNNPQDLLTISKEVDPAYEITAIVTKLEREARRRPVMIFKKVKGSRFPVLTNLHAGRSRLALAMKAAPEKTQTTYLFALWKNRSRPRLSPKRR